MSSFVYDLVIILLMSVFPAGSQSYNQEYISETLNPIYFIDFILRLCWLVSLALETISGTNIFGAVSRDEVEDISFLGYLSVLLVLRGGLKPAFYKAIFHQKFNTVATRGVGRIRKFQLSPVLCSPN